MVQVMFQECVASSAKWGVERGWNGWPRNFMHIIKLQILCTSSNYKLNASYSLYPRLRSLSRALSNIKFQSRYRCNFPKCFFWMAGQLHLTSIGIEFLLGFHEQLHMQSIHAFIHVHFKVFFCGNTCFFFYIVLYMHWKGRLLSRGKLSFCE